ncbi:unnamed protein product [Calypogeia fissa]
MYMHGPSQVAPCCARLGSRHFCDNGFRISSAFQGLGSMITDQCYDVVLADHSTILVTTDYHHLPELKVAVLLCLQASEETMS